MSRWIGWIVGPVALTLLALVAVAAGARQSRSFELRYRCIIDTFAEEAESVQVWLPVPISNEDQEVSDLQIEGLETWVIREEPEFGNHYLFVELGRPQQGGALRLGYRCRVTRHEVTGATKERTGSSPAFLDRALGPDRLVPVKGRPREIARKVAAGRSTTIEKARSFYDWVLEEMTYDKSGTGWGRGDFNYACDVKAGNCTDFHSYFIGLTRAAGIPAVFEIGFPLPPGEKEGRIRGYHCWAKFYLPEVGWMPVDISEADKNPSMREYYFGNLTEDRVMVSRGRDITLEPETFGEPMNFFVYPRAVADGRVVPAVRTEISFRDL